MPARPSPSRSPPRSGPRSACPRAPRELSPPELLRAILLAPADLLYNGGIGTYVKASTETNAEVGDKANDSIRVDGRELRVKVVGEGGNLGMTQRGRIEAALQGVILNTDAIDNSAGVDCSDHEVNIKIFVDRMVAGGQAGSRGAFGVPGLDDRRSRPAGARHRGTSWRSWGWGRPTRRRPRRWPA